MKSKPASKETLGLVKAALAEPTPEEAARKLELVKRLESDIDFRHAIEKRNQVAEEAQNDVAGLGVVRAEELLRKLDAAGQGGQSHDTIRDVAGADVPTEKAAREGLARSRTQPGLQPPPIEPASSDAAEEVDSAPADEDTAPAVTAEARATSRGLIWLGLLALVALGAVIWLVVRGLMPEENPVVPSAVVSASTTGAAPGATHLATSTTSPTTSGVMPSSTDAAQPSSTSITSAAVSAKPLTTGTSISPSQTPWFP